MPTPATAQYFQTGAFGPAIGTATLFDTDLIRGNDSFEYAEASNGFDLFNGFTITTFGSINLGGPGPLFSDVTRTFEDGEILATVTFSDGTTLNGVRGLEDEQVGPYASVQRQFLLDQSALAAVGKTMADVTGVTRTSFTDHDLDWSDFGFSGTPLDPVLPPPPPPPPVLNRIEGTSGRDVLRGTNGDDLIIANGGDRDRLTGRGGEDTFVFGAQVGNGVRDITVITDYDAFEDTLLLTNGAQMARFTEKGDTVTIFLAGADGDRIILQNVPDSGPLFQLQFDDTPFV